MCRVKRLHYRLNLRGIFCLQLKLAPKFLKTVPSSLILIIFYYTALIFFFLLFLLFVLNDVLKNIKKIK